MDAQPEEISIALDYGQASKLFDMLEEALANQEDTELESLRSVRNSLYRYLN